MYAFARGSENTYVAAALRYALEAAYAVDAEACVKAFASVCDITILGDNDFYSQRGQLEKLSLPLTEASLLTLPRFASALSTMSQVHKTGLGSSAAMITSLVGCVLTHAGAADLSTSEGTTLVHNTAQLAHCVAQGKVGSGFDVSAAVYGSHTYRRFSPSVLDGYVRSAEGGVESASVVRKPWDGEVKSLALPRGCDLLLADIDCGSSTPKLVGEVLAWRKANPGAAAELWMALSQDNGAVESAFERLAEFAQTDPGAYDAVVHELATVVVSEWKPTNPIRRTFVELAESFQRVRGHLRRLSLQANVAVEPPAQTRLLDACMAVPGIVIAGVPGGARHCSRRPGSLMDY
ncbi:phosphomevalonate kinase [Thoreauomyces humboldtii]|nr:phosphomevalonate kinase [Thoreauomyces humboldtii]